MSELIRPELINENHNNLLAGYFDIEETQELIAWKYYWETLWYNIESYIQRYNICLASKAVKHKPYRDLQLLPVHTHYCKNLLIDFIPKLPISTNEKGNSSNSIFVIVNQLIKTLYY